MEVRIGFLFSVLLVLTCTAIVGCKDDEEPISSTGDLLWAVQAGGSGGDSGYRIATKPNGAIVVSGNFNETLTFEDTVPEIHETTSAGGSDVFFAQYDSTGRIDWIARAGGSIVDLSSGVAVLSDDRIVTSGWQNDATFGTGESNETTLFGMSGFLSWYNEEGQLSSVRSHAGTSYSLTSGEEGTIVFSGGMSDVTVYGEGEPSETTLTSAGDIDIVVAKYNEDGTLAWAKRAGGTGDDRGYDVAVASDDSIVVVGWCNGATIFGESESSETTLDCTSGSRGFVAKYESNGDLVWVNGLGNPGDTVTISNADEIYVSGSIPDVAVFALGEENETTLNPIAELNEAFLAKFDSEGQLVWVEQMGGSYDGSGDAVGALSDGSAIIAGFFEGQFTVGNPPVEYSVPNTEDTRNFYIARFSPSGEVEWVKTAESSSSVTPSDLSVAIDDTIVLTGSFNDDVTFGVGEANETTLAHTDDSDVFVARFNP